MILRVAASLLLAFALAVPAVAAKKPAPPPPAPVRLDPAATAAALRDRALSDRTAWDVLESLTTEVGGRPTGSPAAARARDWGLAKLTALGFENVRAEPFTVAAWARGAESAELVAPYRRKLDIIGLGRSVPTPPEGVEAEIALFRSYADLLAAPKRSLTGKIAVMTQPMNRTQDISGYGEASRWRSRGPREAALRGAVAYLVRSISTSTSRAPHTGGMSADEPRIPAAALSVPDAEMLERLAAKGPIRIRLSLSSTAIPDAQAWNVSGEIKGSEHPEQVIVIGGHLDSWDPGEGAVDDGAGIAITTAAARLIAQLPRHPKRTIRVVMFGSEELDGSDKAYATAHAAEAANMVAVGESDGGSDRIWSLQLPKGGGAAPALAPLSSVLAPLKVPIAAEPATQAGSDFGELVKAGVPPVSFRQDMSRYFDLHHSADDTLNQVDRDQLNQNVAAWAALLWLIADSDVDFRTPGSR